MKPNFLNQIIIRVSAAISSLRLSVFCLLYCAVVVICGTFYQVEHGLYAAQERFFNSWFFMIAGFFPLPGMQTVLVLAVLNALAAGMKKLPFRFEKTGFFLMHLGVVFLIAGAGSASFFVNESVITFSRNQRVVESVDMRNWELSITIKGEHNGVSFSSSVTRPFSSLWRNQRIGFPQTEKTFTIKRLYQNCQALGRTHNTIDSLLPVPLSSEGNVPGMIVSYDTVSRTSDESNNDILIFGGAGEPVSYSYLSDTFSISLLPRRIKLPIGISLIDFILETHPGTSNAKKIQSRIRATGEKIDREVVISMNHPFRYRSYTFYQTGYYGDKGQESSRLTVVENSVRFLPHAASVIIISGLLFHFIYRLVMALKANRKRYNG